MEMCGTPLDRALWHI